MDVDYTYSQCLDVVQAMHCRRLRPEMFCHITTKGHINKRKLCRAVRISAKYVPEIVYVFNYQTMRFEDKGICFNDIFGDTAEWDPFTGTQLKISVKKVYEGDVLCIGMSHMLSDGVGFKQYLGLLCDIYNDSMSYNEISNKRCIFQGKCRKKKMYFRSLPSYKETDNKKKYYNSVCIDKKYMDLLKQKTLRYGVTINDVFMAAYARVINTITGVKNIAVPCPVDLRKYFDLSSNQLTIANMTGMLRPHIRNIKDSGFDEVLEQVHIKMSRCKKHIWSIKILKYFGRIYYYFPSVINRSVLSGAYRIQTISYTNIGVLDHRHINFKDCEIEKCFITGTYRTIPDFQLLVSTYDNVCTFTSAVHGTMIDTQVYLKIITMVRDEIYNWIKNDA